MNNAQNTTSQDKISYQKAILFNVENLNAFLSSQSNCKILATKILSISCSVVRNVNNHS